MTCIYSASRYKYENNNGKKNNNIFLVESSYHHHHRTTAPLYFRTFEKSDFIYVSRNNTTVASDTAADHSGYLIIFGFTCTEFKTSSFQSLPAFSSTYDNIKDVK